VTPLDNTGKFLMRVRDLSVARLRSQYEGRMRDEWSHAVASSVANLSAEQKMALAAAAVDTVLVTLLTSLEEDSSPALVADGVDVKAVSDGLTGELWGARGWISRFSRFPESA